MTCFFCKIAAGETDTELVYEDDDIVAFNDINPQAPIHLLIIPKKHINTLNDAQKEDNQVLGKMHLTAAKLAKQLGFAEAGYRTIMNCNEHGGQTVFHIHMHLLGGKQMHGF